MKAFKYTIIEQYRDYPNAYDSDSPVTILWPTFIPLSLAGVSPRYLVISPLCKSWSISEKF